MINLTVVIDNDEALKRLRELQNVAKTTTSSVVRDSERMDASWQQMKNTLMSLTAGVSFAALAKQVVQVRGEVQQLEVAFETMLGSKEKASRLLSEAIDLAAKTPFGLQDVSNATKQLLAYGSSAEEVTDEIKMLGNIASGLSIPLGDLIYLYGTTRTQGRMFTMDLRQFMGRGIPLAEELAKQFGVTKDKVGELVTAGKVGFDDMAKALRAMSSEGGKFYNLMDKQSKTIAGQISNLQDSIYQMFNEIGKSSEGVISDLISGASWVVEHYQEILKVLLPLISAYGAYKTAIIVVAAAQKVMALGQSIAMFIDLAKSITSAKDAMLLFNMATNANPLGLLLSVLASIGVAVWQFSKGADDAAKKMGELEKAAYDEYIEVNRLVGRLQDTNIAENERNKLLNKLKGINPDIVQGLEDEATMTAQLTANLKDYNDEQIRKIQLAGLDDKMQGEMKKVGDARLQNAQAQLDWSNFIADYQAKRAAGGSPEIDASLFKSFEGHITNVTGDIYDRFIEQLDRILMDKTTTDAYKMLKISEFIPSSGYASEGSNRFTGDTWGNVKDIGGSNIQNLIKQVYQSAENVKQAEDAFKKVVEEDKHLRAIIGDVADDTDDTGTAVKKYAQAYKDAQKKYLETQRALADAEKNKSKYTEKEYKDIKDNAEAAKKAYEELGGITSSKALRDKEKKAKEAAELAIKLQHDADQAEIDAMREGATKKIAQINLDYEKRKYEIEKEQADLIAKQGRPLTVEQQVAFDTLYSANDERRTKAIQEVFEAELATRDEYLMQYGDARERELAIKRKYDKLMEEAGSNVWQVMLLAKERDELLSEDDKAWNEYLIKYGTFQERLKATTDKYAREIANAKNDAERKALEAERDAILAEFEVQASEWGKELVDMSTTRLTKMLEELQVEVEAKEAALDTLESSDSESAEEYRKTIDELRAKIKALEAELGKGSRQVASGDWAGAAQVFHDIASAANETADGLEGMNDGLAEGLKAFGQLAGAAGSLVSAIGMVIAASGALNMALGVIGLIAAAINAVLSVFSLLKDNYGVAETMRQFKELNTEIERTRELARIDSWNGTIFGEDAFGNFTNNLKVMKDAMSDLAETQEEIINRGKEVWVYDYGSYGDRVYRGITEHQYANIEESIANMQVKTRDRSGFAEFFGAQDEYANLGDLMPTLFGEDGKITLDGLKELRESDVWTKLSQANRDLIDEMISDWELYEEALDATNEYMRDIFGDLGASITDSLVDAFRNGTDAAIAMGDAVSDVVERIITDMAHAAFIQPLLEQAQIGIDALNKQKMEGTMSDEEYMRQLIDITSTLMGNAQDAGDEMYAYLDTMRKMAEEMGIEGVFGSDAEAQRATSKGYQTMSQETGSELNGRFTDIQGQTHRIAEAVEFCKSLHLENLTQVQSINATVAMIHNDTSLIASHTRALANIDANLDALRRSVDNGII